jgi:hypothetical protein
MNEIELVACGMGAVDGGEKYRCILMSRIRNAKDN